MYDRQEKVYLLLSIVHYTAHMTQRTTLVVYSYPWAKRQ